LTDAEGRFNITNLNVTDRANVIVKAVTATNGTNVKITLDQPQPANPLPVYTLVANPQVTTAMLQSYKDDEQLLLAAKGTQLKEVSIRAGYDPNKNKPDLSTSANLNGPGQADQIVMGKDLVGCTTLATCLIGKLAFVSVRNDSIFDNSRGGMTRTSFNVGNPGVVLQPMSVMLNGAKINSLDAVNPSDIYSIEVMTSIRYRNIYGHDAEGGLILITTKRGIPAYDKLTAEKASNLVNYIYNGYYKERTFYTPKYDTPVEAAKDAQRSAIYWKPDILTDKNGKYTLQYINAGPGSYRVVVEGIDTEGRLGRQVYRYTVQ